MGDTLKYCSVGKDYRKMLKYTNDLLGFRSERRRLEVEVKTLVKIATSVREVDDHPAYLTMFRGIGATIRACGIKTNLSVIDRISR